MIAQQISFVKESLQAAMSAGAAFNMNPTVILAQAAFESSWGTSVLATGSNNFFGLTAYGCSNEYWHGGKTRLESDNYALDFRRYDTRRNAFLDFARLIRNNYRIAWQASNNPEAYAREIAYSLYLNELKGDNREDYRHSLVENEKVVRAIMAMM